VADVLDGLTPEQLAYRIDPDANSVSWLVWHLTRVQDDHVAAAFGIPQVWASDGWAPRVRAHPQSGRRYLGGDLRFRAARRVPRGDVRTDGEGRVRDPRRRPRPG